MGCIHALVAGTLSVSQRGLVLALTLMLVLGLAAASRGARAATFRIEIDYMVGSHSHRPQSAEIQAVQQMFACHGHTLVVDVSDAIPHYDVLKLDPGNSNNFFNYSGVPNSFKAIKNQYYDHAGQPGWHYCIFGHNYETVDNFGVYFVTTSSGLGAVSGDDFVVTLGSFTGQIGTAFDRAATLAHEFSHNLGLTHCTLSSCLVIGPYGPNHASIMSYAYQLRGVRTALLCDGLIPPQTAYLFKDVDYSNGTMCSLNENALDETLGTTMQPVDWNCSNTFSTPVAVDLSSDQDLSGPRPGWCLNHGSRETIQDADEWASIVDVTATKAPVQLDDLPTVSCITAEEVARQSDKWSCPAPALVTEACVGGRMLYASVGAGGIPTGDCDAPYGFVKAAMAAAAPNSALFLRPGIYSETGMGPVVMSQPMWLLAVKGARVQ